MTPLLNTTRNLAFGGDLMSARTGFAAASLFTVCLLLVATIFHRIAMPIVIDRANA